MFYFDLCDKDYVAVGLPWWSRGYESALRCGGYGVGPLVADPTCCENTAHAPQLASLSTTTKDPAGPNEDPRQPNK